jgi:acyl-coenzyme A synthetase/AMP-(fatty) acid ligase
LHNQYGPTETGEVTYWQCERDTELHVVPIGRPISNTQIYLLDPNLNPAPVGVAGELYIGGDGVGLGYLNRPELTADKFLRNPFSDHPGARLYRTGDLAHYLPDGAIEYLGRTDHQVKIRGFRVELGEIEYLLNQHPAVGQSVVVAITDSTGDKRLAAYVTPSGREPLETEALRAHLQRSLPDYMVPAVFTVLDALPLSPNGKVDRGVLPAPSSDRIDRHDAYVAPRTPIENLLTSIWCEVLRRDQVAIHDNFFELGGHSLLAFQVTARLKDKIHVDVPLHCIFERPTIAELAIVMLERLQRDEPTPGHA